MSKRSSNVVSIASPSPSLASYGRRAGLDLRTDRPGRASPDQRLQARLTGSAPSLTSCSIDLVLKRFESIPPPVDRCRFNQADKRGRLGVAGQQIRDHRDRRGAGSTTLRARAHLFSVRVRQRSRRRVAMTGQRLEWSVLRRNGADGLEAVEVRWRASSPRTAARVLPQTGRANEAARCPAVGQCASGTYFRNQRVIPSVASTSLTFAERRNFRSVPASRCAAEQSAVRFRAIDEPKRAPGARTALHERGLLSRDQRRDLCSDDRDQLIRGIDAPPLSDLKPVLRDDHFGITRCSRHQVVQAAELRPVGTAGGISPARDPVTGPFP